MADKDVITEEVKDHDLIGATLIRIESQSNEFRQDEVSSQKHTEMIPQKMNELGSPSDGVDRKCSQVMHPEPQDAGVHIISDDCKDKFRMNKENESNPFARFAFGATEICNSTSKRVRSRNWIEPEKKKANTNKSEKKQEWIPMSELSQDDRERVLTKWHNLSNASSALEDRRFQVMVASRLHARCQESVVRKCMTVLQEAGVLTCISMAQADPEVLASLLTSLQYYNTKAKHLVQASKEILEHFQGQVPESKEDLLKLTGIGPVMADLLSNINTREAFRR